MQRTTKRIARVTLFAGSTVAVAVLTLAGSLRSAETTFRAPVAAAAGASSVPGAQQGNPAPLYPDLLRSAEIEGTVVVDVRVDARGVPDMSTFTVATSTHALFTNAVRAAVAKWRVSPNTNLHQPFAFFMSDKTGALLGANGRQTGIRIDGVDAVVVVAQPAEGFAVRPGQVNEVRTSNPVGGAASGIPAGTPTPVSSAQTFFEFQVEHPARPAPGNVGPRYPDSLRTANVEGEVLAQFVVDTLGHPDMSTFKVLKSTHELFTQTVRDNLGTMAFYPARVGGKAVKQLVQMPFNFSLAKD